MYVGRSVFMDVEEEVQRDKADGKLRLPPAK